MTYLRFPYSIIVGSILLSACYLTTFAQSENIPLLPFSRRVTPVNTIYFRDIALYNGQNPDRPIDVRISGSIRGRVFNDADLNENTRSLDSQGIRGVRVILRSADFKSIARYQISDANGTFDFPNLSPGKYTIELDPVSIPAKFRIPPVTVRELNIESARTFDVDLPITAKRTISGIVFIDKDGDGQYKAGKDSPVEGALITVGGNLARSNVNGRYILDNLPAGRIGLLIRWPKRDENTQVVLYLDAGPVTNRIVNIPRNR